MPIRALAILVATPLPIQVVLLQVTTVRNHFWPGVTLGNLASPPQVHREIRSELHVK
jgi:hypothetical protein